MGSDGKLHFVDKEGADTALNFNIESATTVIYLLVHHDGTRGDQKLALGDITYDPSNSASLATNGIIKIVDGGDFSINDNNITVNKNGTMLILGQLGAQGGTYHYDKIINSTRSILNNQYGHFYDTSELKENDVVYFIYNNTEPWWWTGSAVIVFQ